MSQLALNRFVELRFEPVRREHFGNYTCLAKNLADITTTYANLLVECKYLIDRIIPFRFSSDRPVYIGPNIPVIFSVVNYRGANPLRNPISICSLLQQ